MAFPWCSWCSWKRCCLLKIYFCINALKQNLILFVKSCCLLKIAVTCFVHIEEYFVCGLFVLFLCFCFFVLFFGVFFVLLLLLLLLMLFVWLFLFVLFCFLLVFCFVFLFFAILFVLCVFCCCLSDKMLLSTEVCKHLKQIQFNLWRSAVLTTEYSRSIFYFAYIEQICIAFCTESAVYWR